MENEELTPESSTHPQLIVSEEMRSYLYEMAKWATFLAIVGFVFTGLMVVSAFTIGAAVGTNPELASLKSIAALGGAGLTLVCLLYAFAIFYPSLLLFKYASRAKLGVLYGDQNSLNEALLRLKSLFKYWGIMTIVLIGFYIIALFSTVMTMKG
ncbi:hypothetical protein VRU48_00785 [Pedobacter sp. KR3-3]|uniref:DUF5362 domain-containing protein n=1 Tax=Pedobacter albus TaxID=3113905 RepID=A0ABU7I2D9_9SPHI|nr:hypothetical protein [Pedobacter sp. KR3-3]MEE1943620.1 hypothetical protein [Pedobacter sp. KR3-3]